MSAELHKSHPAGNGPIHENVAFDSRDVSSRSVLKFLVSLGITIAAALLVCWGVFRLTESRITRLEAPPTPVRQGIGSQLPPEPRLQGVPGHAADPQQDLRDKVARDRADLDELRWVDEKTGIAQIPIDDAMKIIAEKGLPVQPGPPGAHAAKTAEAKKP